MALLDDAFTYVGNGVQVTSGAASASQAIPLTADGKKARYCLCICPTGYVYIKPYITSGTATVNDIPVVSTGTIGVVLNTTQFTGIAYIQGSVAAPLNIIPIEF